MHYSVEAVNPHDGQGRYTGGHSYDGHVVHQLTWKEETDLSIKIEI